MIASEDAVARETMRYSSSDHENILNQIRNARKGLAGEIFKTEADDMTKRLTDAFFFHRKPGAGRNRYFAMKARDAQLGGLIGEIRQKFPMTSS